MASDDVLDETYDRLRATGPEFEGWLSNHGPMAADALIRMGCGDEVERWLDSYITRLDKAPATRWQIDEEDWREVIGDPSRLGDWCALFARLVGEEHWSELLTRWWPRLLPGAIASAGHGLIRTGHVVRALRERQTPQRLEELALALGYWAARWQPLPAHPAPTGTAPPSRALGAVPVIAGAGGIRTRLADLGQSPDWPASVARLMPIADTEQIPAALDHLVDAAVTRYPQWAHGSPIMLVHAATAPRAAALVVPSLPRNLWLSTYETAWAVSAAISGAYRPATAPPPPSRRERQITTAEDVADRAGGTGDEHAIKFAEVALESHRRENPNALAAGARAAVLIAPDDYDETGA